ncbi:hypothetical protein AVEN_235247-1 [Araneus ventricosus]|uniref:Uncharacterized protein n=1 Tax=Araneus ventricosus TaxID=182803 RepID=A0A4Y2A5M8_ARAVE|nr:hypothetical protein AVEN_235247-1 [Araneus ventricosus]
MKDGFAERFEQFKTNNKSTLAFIVNHLNTNTNEISIEPFGSWIASNAIAGFENQRLVEWQVHRTQEQVGRVGGPEMHAYRATQVDSSKRNSTS